MKPIWDDYIAVFVLAAAFGCVMGLFAFHILNYKLLNKMEVYEHVCRSVVEANE